MSEFFGELGRFVNEALVRFLFEVKINRRGELLLWNWIPVAATQAEAA